MNTTTSKWSEATARDLAIRRLRKRHEFVAHVLTYVLVNTLMVAIWVFTSSGGFFWPVFFIGFWGIALVLQGWDVWHGDEPSEAAVRREIERIQDRQ